MRAVSGVAKVFATCVLPFRGRSSSGLWWSLERQFITLFSTVFVVLSALERNLNLPHLQCGLYGIV